MALRPVAKVETKTTSEIIAYETKAVPFGRIRICVEGKSPLLTHNPESMTIVAEAKKGGKIPPAEVEAEAGTYRNEDGTCCLRGEMFRASLLGAAGAWRLKKSSMRYALAHIVVLEDLLPLQRYDESLITDYIIDARRAIVQKNGIIRRRPKFDEWRTYFTVEYDPQLVADPKIILDILQDAGGRIGVGDYRPVKNGWFGRFVVKNYQLL